MIPIVLGMLACSGQSDPVGASPTTSETETDTATAPTGHTGVATDSATSTASTGATGHTGATGIDTGAEPCPGCLIDVQSLGRFPLAYVQGVVDPRVEVLNGYEVFVVDYETEGGRVATATITLPIDATAPADGWPIVANNHGTIGLDDPCRLSGTVSGSGLAALFGARGAIGVAPDYLGLGGPGVHRYLDLYDEAVAVLDALRAAEHLAADQKLVTSGRMAAVGLSQGGHATLAAATWHSRYAPELDIRAFGVAGPASVYAEHWSDGVGFPGSHLTLHAMLTWSFAEAEGAPLTGVWASGFDPEPVLLGRCGWDPDFSGDPTFYEGFPTLPEAVFSESFLTAYRDGSFTGFGFMEDAFARNRLEPWLDVGTQTAPIAVWQGTNDDVVPLPYTADLVETLQDGGIDITLHEVPGATHYDTAFGFVAAWERATEDSVSWVLEAVE